jgi:hypothetical protein
MRYRFSRMKDKTDLRIDPNVRIMKNVPSGTFRFTELFVGFDNLAAVKGIFGKALKEELDKLVVEVFPKEGFMGVSDEDGHIFASQQYINSGENWSVYLDVIHELVHVRQFRQGRNLFDPKYVYVDRPTEIEAYAVAVGEGRRIGMSEEEIFNYLEVPWISLEEHRRLAKSTGVKVDEVAQSLRKDRN